MSKPLPDHIDELFQKKLQNFESVPMEDSWAKIAQRLPEGPSSGSKSPQQPKIFKLYNYWMYAAAACLVLGILATSIFLFDKGKNENQISEITPTATSSETKEPKVTANANNSETLASKDTLERNNSSSVHANTLSNHKNIKRTVTLPDGSLAILNKNSELSFDDKNLNQRTIYVSGEVFLKVKHQKNQPFTIYANLSKIEVLGTSFIVRSYKKENFDEVQVSSGKVSFGKLDGSGLPLVLSTGEKGIVRSEQNPVKEEIKNKNYDSWVSGKIEFDNTPLSEVFKTLEQHYDISVTSSNPEILNCRFTGIFEQSEINEVLDVLSIQFNLKYNKASQNYNIAGEGCQ